MTAQRSVNFCFFRIGAESFYREFNRNLSKTENKRFHFSICIEFSMENSAPFLKKTQIDRYLNSHISELHANVLIILGALERP